MPKIRTLRTKKPPAGFDEIEPTILDMERKMREVENRSHEGFRRNETIWGVLRLNHQRSRYIWDALKDKTISRELYDWCVREKYADAGLIAKWKKQGYENLCCVTCVQTKDTNFGTTCICRVPKAQLEKGRNVECVHCGCRGCGG